MVYSNWPISGKSSVDFGWYLCNAKFCWHRLTDLLCSHQEDAATPCVDCQVPHAEPITSVASWHWKSAIYMYMDVQMCIFKCICLCLYSILGTDIRRYIYIYYGHVYNCICICGMYCRRQKTILLNMDDFSKIWVSHCHIAFWDVWPRPVGSPIWICLKHSRSPDAKLVHH